jgi:CTP synthase
VKYVIVSGGVLSGLGKGVTASSIGVLLKSAGLNVTAIKIDPYLNSDAGTMSPFEHGEVFVLDDGGEADLDLGNYERFLDVTLGKDNNLTTGKIYSKVIESERRGDYLGKTVQVVPHITDSIQDWIEDVAHVPEQGTNKVADVCVVELGGTVGDIESAPFIEALRQFQFRVGSENICFVHVSLVPVMGPVGEQKTKPTQHSVRELRGLGITPDVIICRSKTSLTEDARQKIALFCHVESNAVLSASDVSNIYKVPLLLDQQGALVLLSQKFKFKIPVNRPLLDEWMSMAIQIDDLDKEVCIAMVGKYTGLSDSYLSVIKALNHASIASSRKLNIEWIEASNLENNVAKTDPEIHADSWERLKSADGILVPGGFGDRGIEGKILAAEYARTSSTPYLGICLGLQIAVIEFCRNVLGWKDSNSTEFNDNTPHPVVIYMPEISKTHLGGTMRLGSRRTIINDEKSIAFKLYNGNKNIHERHRHRYEVNPDLIESIEDAGMKFVGKDDTGQRMEILEISNHPFFFATQYHPEFKTRPTKPSPPFYGFLMASSKQF